MSKVKHTFFGTGNNKMGNKNVYQTMH